MLVRTVCAAHGWRWMIEGISLAARRPLPIVPMFMLVLLTMLLLALPAPLGGALTLIAAPGLLFGFTEGVRQVEQGRMVPPWAVYAGFDFRRHPGAAGSQIKVGVFNAVTTLLVATLAAWIDQGATAEWMQAGPEDAAASLDARPLWAALVFVILYTPAQMATWFAPFFIGWHGTPAIKALFFSLVVCWRNRGAFIVYGLAWMAMALLASLLVGLLASLLQGLALFVVVPFMAWVMSAVYCSIWASCRDLIPEPAQGWG